MPIRPCIRAKVAALRAPKARTERRHRDIIGIIAHIQDEVVIAAVTETPRGKRMDISSFAHHLGRA